LPVVNVASAPEVVPDPFVATTRKWYLVFGIRLAIAADALTPVVPLPALLEAVFVPYVVVVPYSK
jgi:hypothetical protein